MSENKVSEMIESASEHFKGMINANSVIGDPIQMEDGTIILPISRVSFGFGGGGSEFDAKKTDDTHFGGGMGGGASVKAEAFLVINNSNVRLISMNGSSTAMDKLVDMMPGMLDKVNGFIAARREKKAAKKEGAEPVVTGEAYDNE